MIKLWENTPGFDESLNQKEPFITPYLVESKTPAPCVIVCPGGGYEKLAEYEGGPVCEWLNSIGISAFWLRYRITPYNHKLITNDALRAIRFVRYNAKEYNIDKNKVGILGFSAGGHLCSSAMVHFDDAILNEDDPVDKESSRPDCTVLCYPVISSDAGVANTGSFKNLLGDDMTIELLDYYSSEKHVKENTSPVFLWHTAEDTAVPCTNSILMAKALREKNIPFEFHIYPEGPHGMGLAEGKYAQDWTEACGKWLKYIFRI